MIRLQRCMDCGQAQYPPRKFCGACLSGRVSWEEADALPGCVLAVTWLHHSNESSFRARLPLKVGLVRLEVGPGVVCFVADAAVGGDAVVVRTRDDGLLAASIMASDEEETRSLA